jgi:hypothetical protein
MSREVYVITRNVLSLLSFYGVRKTSVNLFPFCVTKTETLNEFVLWKCTVCERLPTSLPLHPVGGNLDGFRHGLQPHLDRLDNSCFFFQHKQDSTSTL